MRQTILYTCAWLALMLAGAHMPTHAQSVLDGAYVKETNLTKRVIPYPYLREADVMYKRRIWQDIDLRQKFNHPFYFPLTPIQDRKNLFDVIMNAIEVEGSIVPYYAGPLGEQDEFQEKMLPGSPKWKNAVGTMNYVAQTDEYGERTGDFDSTWVRVTAQEVTRYRIKDEWIWDKQRSERYVRIIGIAPLKEKYKDGVSIGFQPLFWLYYPECRYVFANSEVYNMFNDAQRRTYEDLFQKRYFSSYIVKEDNSFDRLIVDYALGTDALAESERIQRELFNLEHDMWHY
jgi:gliding motility associated protien GldN